MTTITILPETADSYRALAGEKESTGRTPGEALDALTAQLGDDETGALVIVQTRKADEFFTAAQQERLADLMQLREAGRLSTEEEQELERLVEAELVGATERAKIIAGANTYERLVSNAEFANVFRGVAASLSEQQRLTLGMYLGGLKVKEIAERLGTDQRVISYELNIIRTRILFRLNKAKTQDPTAGEPRATETEAEA